MILLCVRMSMLKQNMNPSSRSGQGRGEAMHNIQKLNKRQTEEPQNTQGPRDRGEQTPEHSVVATSNSRVVTAVAAAEYAINSTAVPPLPPKDSTRSKQQ